MSQLTPSKLTVNNLKEQLQARGIPLTGLKLKKDFVARLEKALEEERAQVEAQNKEEEEQQPPISEEPESNEKPAEDTAMQEAAPEKNDVPKESPEPAAVAEPPAPVEKEESLPQPEEMPVAEENDATQSSKVEVTKESVKESISTGHDSTISETAASRSVTVTTIEEASATSGQVEKPQGDIATPIEVDLPSAKRKHEETETPLRGDEPEAESKDNEKAAEPTSAKKIRRTVSTNAIKMLQTNLTKIASNAPQEEENKKQEQEEQEEPEKIEQDQEMQPVNASEVPESQHPPTTTLAVRNFVRPLQVKQVEELLNKFGKVEKFWMDSIKTHCYVTYSSVDEAILARSRLYNLRFPTESHNPLLPDFLTPERAQRLIEEEESAQASNARRVSKQYGAHGSSKEGNLGRQDAKISYLPLDNLFPKTTATPSLYFLPVSEELAKKRLEEMRRKSK
ncbi:uncharacterized protein VTP21DRAFT_7039 [Calcarisporiella thermophila]|uniref:uncharacterized protein n=1 Tax=Calcarisporiella thermophila TaxID=911321 RepID=UPI003743AC5D